MFELLNKDFFVSSLQNCNGAMVDKKSLFSFPRSLKAIRRAKKAHLLFDVVNVGTKQLLLLPKLTRNSVKA